MSDGYDPELNAYKSWELAISELRKRSNMLKFHPLAEVFPLIEGAEFDALVADIKANGLHDPITLLNDTILDGRNRYRACLIAEVEPRFVLYAEASTFGGKFSVPVWNCPKCNHNWPESRDACFNCHNVDWQGITTDFDPVAFVVSKNVARRHLDESQRAIAAAKIATIQHGGDRSKRPVGHLKQQEASDLLNVGERSVRRAREVLDEGDESLVKAVETGKVSVSAAADVATLPKAEQAEIVAKGEKEILEAAKRIRAAKSEARREERIEKIAEISRGNSDMATDRKYPVIYADPPWRYEFAESETRAIENQYPTMSLDDIKALPVSGLATDDAILFMWATSPKLEEAFEVIRSWGFTYRSSAIWVKNQLGMGYYFRQQHELLLVATRGSMPAPAPADRPRSVFTSDRTEHSAKPSEFAQYIEAMYPTLPRVELFCRSPRDGWSVWGNQAVAA